MKVVQIGAAYVGAQKEIEYAIHKFLIDNGICSTILYCVGNSNEGNIIRCETKIESLLRRFLVKMCGKHPVFGMASTIRIIKKIKHFEPDVVHLHVLHHNFIDYPLLFRYLIKKQIPVVYTMHDMWAFTGGCYHYSNYNCNGFLKYCRGCTNRDIDCNCKSTNKKLEEKKYFYAHLKNIAFVSVSDWVNSELEKSFLRKYCHKTIWNAYQLPTDFQILQTRNKVNQKKRIVGVANNWDKRKGFFDFLLLAEKLGNDYEVILIGNISDSIKKDIPQNVIFLGIISDKKELLRQYAAADLHVSMSCEETFGLTFIEAAAVGTRSIGFNLTAIPYVLNKIGGIVVQNHNVKEMVNTIKDFFEKSDSYKLTNKEVQNAKDFFCISKMAGEYFDIYKSALEGKC